MELITKEIEQLLLENGRRPDQDHCPVVKFFDPCGAATWLISQADPQEPDILFGLCRALHNPNYDERGVMLSCARNST